jgi:hypothetical protein
MRHAILVIYLGEYVAESDKLITPLDERISLLTERTNNTVFLIALTAVTCLVAYRVAPESIPQRWASLQSAPNEYEIRLDHRIFHSSKASLHMRSRLGSPKGFAKLSQRLIANDYRGTRLHMSAFLKTEITWGSVRLWLQTIGEGGSVLAFDDMHERPVTGTTGWTRYDFTLDVPQQARDIEFGVILAGNGQVWADDFTIRAGGNEVYSDSIEMVYGP